MALRLWLPLNGNLNNQGLDDVTITATGSSYQDDGKIGKCLRLGYTNNFTIPSMVGAKQMTIAYWCRVNTATATNWLDAIHFYSTNGSETSESRHEFFSNCTDTGFWYKGGSVVMYGSHIVIGEWNHFAFTFNYITGEVSFYFNGSLFQTKTDLDTTHYITGTNFRLGQSGLDVSENDVRIYDNCLSHREIKEISKGLVLHYPLAMPGQENLVKQSNQFRVGTHAAKITPSLLEDGTYQVIAESGNSNYTSSWWMTLDGIENNFVEGEVFTVSFTIKSSDANTTTPPKIYLKEGMGYFQMIGKVVESWSTVYYTGTWKKENSLAPHLGWYGLVGTYQISNWKLEKGSRPTPWLPNSTDPLYAAMGYDDGIEYDVSGYQRNGTKNGSITYVPDASRYNMSSVFNGSNYIESVALPLETKTISIWMKTTSNTGGYRFAVFAKNIGMAIGFSDTRIISYVGSGNGGTGSSVQTNGKYIANQWNHIVVVKTGDTTRDVYVNGEKLNHLAANYWGGDYDQLLIGCRHMGNTYQSYLTGELSDFRAYSTALSADDVMELYHTPIALSHNGTLLTQGEYVEV